LKALKSIEKIIQNPTKFDQNQYIFTFQSDTMVTSGVYAFLSTSFVFHNGFPKSVVGTKNKEKPEPKLEKPKTTSDTKSENLLVFFMKSKNQIIRKSANHNGY